MSDIEDDDSYGEIYDVNDNELDYEYDEILLEEEEEERRNPLRQQ